MTRLPAALRGLLSIFVSFGVAFVAVAADGWQDVFNPLRVTTLHLAMSAGDWAAVQGDADFNDPRPAQFWADGETSIAVTVKRKSEDRHQRHRTWPTVPGTPTACNEAQISRNGTTFPMKSWRPIPSHSSASPPSIRRNRFFASGRCLENERRRPRKLRNPSSGRPFPRRAPVPGRS